LDLELGGFGVMAGGGDDRHEDRRREDEKFTAKDEMGI
jgi:hypothetical protein